MVAKTWKDSRDLFRRLEKERPFDTGFNINMACNILEDQCEKARFIDWITNPLCEPRTFTEADLTEKAEVREYSPLAGQKVISKEISERNGGDVLVIRTGPVNPSKLSEKVKPCCYLSDDSSEDEKKMDN